MNDRRQPYALSLMAMLLAACSTSSNARHGQVGVYDGADAGGTHSAGTSGNMQIDSGVVGNDNALTVHVEDLAKTTIEIVTLQCAGDCADVVAVAHGGNAPYTFKWEDGSTNAKRSVCPTSSTHYKVSVMDTAITDTEFQHDIETATANVTATVLDCSDSGAAADGGGTSMSAYWATWTKLQVGTPGTESGTLSPPGGDVSVSYAGDVVDGSAITGQPSVSGTATVTFAPESTFVSSSVTNAPPETGMIGLYNDTKLTETITFSEPVRDPLIAVISMGNIVIPCSWTFDAAPVVLSSGVGVYNQSGMLTVSGNTITGAEGNGVVQFAGTFTTLSFTVTSAVTQQDFGAFTVGIRGRP